MTRFTTLLFLLLAGAMQQVFCTLVDVHNHQHNERAASSSADPVQVQISVYSVLATAIPASLFSIGQTNPGAVGSILSSEFAAGLTPAWYSSLPSDVKSYLATAAPAGPTTSVVTVTQTGAVTVVHTITSTSVHGSAATASNTGASSHASATSTVAAATGQSTGVRVGLGKGMSGAFVALAIAMAACLLL
ncbi:hypothetical protein K432DRAFT_397926 [Lepidopterella palustris CBS 459.81]|uniref:Uncharacterized protein n=1 Tax=Lepidopterella palustris CBS 459.81 TaxID=1314670 RepID=A0A8E2JAC0_9PEZI|nr:hypothetical protein K432DRAFT_397926 [Lepidopterella palustris CBS 459.81]